MRLNIGMKNYYITDWNTLTKFIELNSLDWEGLLIQDWAEDKIIVFNHRAKKN